MKSEAPPGSPPDREARETILTQLDRNLLVEASAGTGKTTSMVGRMLALVVQGKCDVSQIAAVTFTRKAAAELRSRFHLQLERAVAVAEGTQRERLARALASVDACHVGTIHAFASRILRERPIEANVDPGFTLLEPEVDVSLRAEVWRSHVAGLYARQDETLEELIRLGLEPGLLRDAFEQLAENPDLEWPLEPISPPSLDEVGSPLEERVNHLRRLADELPEKSGDTLIQRARRVVARSRQVDWTQLVEVFELLELCEELPPSARSVMKDWPGASKEERKARREEEADRWSSFAARSSEVLGRWRAARYAQALRTLRPALEEYDRRRSSLGALNHQDLLIAAARLVRESTTVRVQLQRRYSHLLVDEIQDTDPIQAELLLLLASEDPDTRSWRDVRPKPGSLFVVGDPKQSIYRFRRADVRTYLQVKEIISRTGGEVILLRANFRSHGDVLGWINSTFQSLLGTETTPYQNAYAALETGKSSSSPLTGPRLRILELPRAQGRSEELEAQWLAGEIATRIAAGARAGDFLVVTHRKKGLAGIAAALRARGVPIQVSGGNFLQTVEELPLLIQTVTACLEPNNPVALVAALRGGAFGVTDQALYDLSCSGGAFSFLAPPPRRLAHEHPESFAVLEPALLRLTRYASWLRRLPPLVALERIASDLGLLARAAGSAGGNVQAGSLLKAFQTLRGGWDHLNSLRELVAHFDRLVGQGTGEQIGSLEALAGAEPGVRLMNLHKAKGLEAPHVFLAYPHGRSDHPVTFHVDRGHGAGRAYALIGEPKEEGRFNKRKPLAAPLRWEELALEESRYLEAEERRLLYVAATRAGEELTLSLPSLEGKQSPKKNPWELLREHTQNFERIQATQVPAPVLAELSVPPGELEAAAVAAEERWSKVLGPSYSLRSARSGLGTSLAAHGGEAEGGAALGTVVHTVLEAELRRPGRDLGALATTALELEELDGARAAEVVDLVRGVLASPLWARALRSRRRLAEVPFEYMEPGAELPTLTRGVIDLAFEEEEGWVLVDYKTDQAAVDRPEELLAHYRSQLEAYRTAWPLVTGERVKEAGLYLVRAGQYVLASDTTS